MIALIQRVSRASVEVDGECTGAIGPGMLALVCAEPGDGSDSVARLLTKLLAYRIFADAAGKMNHSVQNIDGAGTAGGLLLVPQFTLAADTHSGTRPSFSGAAEPALARACFDDLLTRARALHADVACGVFGASMQVSLINDGPVTFWLHARPVL